jgi:hypothetical protein
MPLSRLDNFLKNAKGNIIYVDPNNLDATDGVTNQGNSLGRPFLTLQRALIESSRFSYQRGLDNDRFEKTTIYLAPGVYNIDNRPGWIPTGANTFLLRNGDISGDFPQLNNTSNFNIFDPDNILYKVNSIYGGVIIPRGVSIVGQDLRKVQIRPLYVPNPENKDIENSAIFRVTGGVYMNSFTIKDAETTKACYKDYTTNTFTPTFSHHKLTGFEYADGRNAVSINDEFIDYSTDRTDLDMYYEKVGLLYGPSSGREIEPDFPSADVDIQPKIDEFRIVGPVSGTAGITSIKAGDGVIPTTIIDVELSEALFGLNVDTNVIINDVSDIAYNGTFLVTEVTSTTEEGATGFKYEVPFSPSTALPNPTGTSVELSTDTVSSASPYIFNVSLRSVYGLCGMHADGSKADGFKSMVVAQYTGVGLQIDDKAFVKYNTTSGSFDDSTVIPNLHTDIDAVYKPDYSNYHIKASNNSLIQLVSIFAIGYSNHFLVESGADFSVTNSNSNFGQIALTSRGFKENVFSQDNFGYISQLIPPKTLKPENVTIEFSALDISKTTSVADTSRLYLYQQTNKNNPPNSTIQGYRFGASNDEKLNVIIPVSDVPTNFVARVVMEDTANATNKVSGKKISRVGRNVSTGNSITNSTLTFIEDHQFIQGESIRLIANDARLPDGVDSNTVYFSIVDGLDADQIQIAQTLNDALIGENISINNLGGTLIVESRVSDKNAGDIGHPIQYDTAVNNWYVNVSSASSENNLYDKITHSSFGEATSRSYITRLKDTRQSDDRIHRLRFVIPSNTGTESARPPLDGYIIQESSTVTGENDAEVALEFNPGSVTMNNDTQMRNFSFIADATYENGDAIYTTEKPHGLKVGSIVKINNITSDLFPEIGVGNSGYNGTYTVNKIIDSKNFSTDQIETSPGIFNNDTSQRTTSLPTFSRNDILNNYYVYNTDTINEYKNGEQDGIYYLSVIKSNIKPTSAPFNTSEFSFSQPVQNLYPQLDRDNAQSTSPSSDCHALSENIGEVVINEPKNSITGETLDEFFSDTGIGIGVTDIVTDPLGIACTIFTDRDHGLSRATKIVIDNPGTSYGNGSPSIQFYYNAVLENITSGSVGDNATALVTVDGTSEGEIIQIQVMDGGSAYVEGDRFRVVGIATTTGFSPATGSISKIYDNRTDIVNVTGIKDFDGKPFNSKYRIIGVSSTNKFEVVPIAPTQTGISTLGIGNDSGTFSVIGPSYEVSSFLYNEAVGIATVTTSIPNQFRVNNSINVSGAGQTFYNGSFVCLDKIDLNTVELDVGISTIKLTIDGDIRISTNGISNNFGESVVGSGVLHGREQPIYAGITTTLATAITSRTIDTIDINNMTNYNFLIGDFIQIDDEIMRIKTTVSRNTGAKQLRVFRGVYGTVPTTHVVNSVVQRIRPYPIEFRRNSIIRASAHTFEYIGYGPGNYSTAFPSKQTKTLTIPEQINVQAQKTSGGVVNYTGMNDRGDFYIGNKRIASATGSEQVYDTPIQTVTGEDPFSTGNSEEVSDFNFVETSNLKAERNIIIDGGDNNNILSEFNGPVQFSKKVVSTSSEGLEANHFFIQGNASVSRKITVGISTPVQAGNPGDIELNANPSNGGTVGWVFTTNNEWKTFGVISS